MIGIRDGFNFIFLPLMFAGYLVLTSAAARCIISIASRGAL